jgi:hypothetical protein
MRPAPASSACRCRRGFVDAGASPDQLALLAQELLVDRLNRRLHRPHDLRGNLGRRIALADTAIDQQTHGRRDLLHDDRIVVRQRRTPVRTRQSMVGATVPVDKRDGLAHRPRMPQLQNRPCVLIGLTLETVAAQAIDCTT